MKKIFLAILLCPLFSMAQNILPGFVNDTLTTSGGYKIYKGQTLQLGTGTSAAGYFSFIKFHQSLAKNNTYSLQNSTVLVKNLKAYKYSSPDNNSIRIMGTVTYKDGKKEETDLVINFERATENYNGLPSELNIPETMKPNRNSQPATNETEKVNSSKTKATQANLKNTLIADELKKLFDLYQAGALTKDEYDAQKKKLLEKQ